MQVTYRGPDPISQSQSKHTIHRSRICGFQRASVGNPTHPLERKGTCPDEMIQTWRLYPGPQTRERERERDVYTHTYTYI